MVAYPGADPFGYTYAVFQALVDAAFRAKAILNPLIDGKIVEHFNHEDLAERENREIVMKMWFPTIFPEDANGEANG